MQVRVMLKYIIFCVFALCILNASAAQLIALYEFENDPNDSSGNNLNGLAVGSPVYGTGIFGNAIYFDGIDDYINCGSDPNLNWVGSGRSGRTVTFWATSDWTATQSKQPTLIAKDGTNNWRMQRRNNTATTNKLDFQTTGTTPLDIWVNSGANNPPLSSTWHHYAITDNGSVKKLFYDGAKVVELTYTGVCAETVGQLTIGGNPSAATPATRYWKGWVDDLAIFDYALTEGQVLAVKDSGAGNLPEPVMKATYPVPSNGSVQNSARPFLEWVPGFLATSHKLYFSASAQEVLNRTAPYVTIEAPTASYTPSNLLEFNKTYYWCVDEVNGGTTLGDVWSFTTGDSYVLQAARAFSTEEQLLAAWQGSVIEPFLTTATSWMGFYYSPLACTYTHDLGDLNLSFSKVLTVTYNFNSAVCGTGHQELTLKLLGAGDAVLYSGTLGEIDSRPAGSAYQYNFDLSNATSSLSSVRKMVFELSPAAQDCYRWIAIGDIVLGDSVCGTGTIYSLYDLNKDCVTDITELEIIAADWLDSFIVQ